MKVYATVCDGCQEDISEPEFDNLHAGPSFIRPGSDDRLDVDACSLDCLITALQRIRDDGEKGTE